MSALLLPLAFSKCVSTFYCLPPLPPPNPTCHVYRSWLSNVIRTLQSQAAALRSENPTDTGGLTLTMVWDACDAELTAADEEVGKGSR